ncbi:hypothetical protein M378DRAFT_168943, partial [Amanita muscaria Koide BX008]
MRKTNSEFPTSLHAHTHEEMPLKIRFNTTYIYYILIPSSITSKPHRKSSQKGNEKTLDPSAQPNNPLP